MRELRLMTWNVRYFGHGLKGLLATKSWMARLADAVASMEQLPDVIALQEVEARSLRAGLLPETQLEQFMTLLAERLYQRGAPQRYISLYYPAHEYAVPSAPPIYTTGLAILVADDLEVQTHNAESPFDITHRPDSPLAVLKQTRIAAHIRVRRGDGPALDVFNTHLSLPSFSEVGLVGIQRSMGHGSNQIREVQTLLEAVASEAGGDHRVLVGDFNSAPGTPAYRAVLESGFDDAFAQHIRHDPAVLSDWSTARFGASRMHIDHVFSTPNVSWLEFADYTASRGGPFHGLSDHVPLIGRLRMDD